MIQVKKHAYIIAAIILIATFVAPSFAQTGEVKPSSRAAASDPAASLFQTVGANPAASAALVSEFDVNGLKVLVKRRAGSQTVAAGLYLRGGARNLTPQNAGIEALMLEAATEASRNFPRERLRAEQARMGTGIGAQVTFDYSALALRCTRTNFARSWEMFADVALHPTFAPDDVARVQSRMLTALRSDTDDPDAYLQKVQEQVAYVGHPYLNRPQGTAETMAKFTPEDLKRYHAQMMQTSRLLLVIVGDIDPQMIRRLAEESFGKLPKGDYVAQAAPPLEFKTPTVEVTSVKLPTNYVQGVFAAPSLTSPDIYAMRVASSILRDRVFQEVRVRRNLSYAPNAFLGSQGANLGGIYVTAVDANQAVGVMLNEIAHLQQEPVGTSDVTAIVSEYLTNYYLGEETNPAQVEELASYELVGGGWRNSTIFIEKLRAVTPADVQRVAQKYMRNLQFVVIGDPARIDKRIFTAQAGG